MPLGMLNEANLKSLNMGKGTGALYPETIDSARDVQLGTPGSNAKVDQDFPADFNDVDDIDLDNIESIS